MKKIILFLSFISTSFAATGFSSSSHAESSAPASGLAPAVGFRDYFLGSLPHSYSPAELKELIYLPTQALLKAPKLSSGAPVSVQEFLDGLRSNLRKMDPFDAYRVGAAIPAHPKSPDAALARAPITVVVLPGIFGGVIKAKAFGEVFAKDSAFKTEWQTKLAAYRTQVQSTQSLAPNLKDDQFSLETMSIESRPLEELVTVGSIDSTEGVPLVKVIHLNLEFMALESVGDIREKSAIFERRLRKVFEITGLPEHLAVLGYSRGAMVGLEMVARAAENPGVSTWISRLRGVVSLGGVIYGSDMADQVVNEQGASALATPFFRMKALLDPVTGLQEIGTRTGLARLRVVSHNLGAFKNFLLMSLNKPKKTSGSDSSSAAPAANESDALDDESIALAAEPPADDSAEAALGSDADANAPGAASALRSIDFGQMMAVGRQFATRAFHLSSPQDYDKNIRRFRKMISEGMMGITQLSTAERLAWWRENQIPAKVIDQDGKERSVIYYSIAATMMDPEEKTSLGPKFQAVRKGVAESRACYDPRLPDYHLLLTDYRDFRDATGFMVNDSQMAAHKTRLWPELMPLLNSAQKPVESRYLGLLGTHHWGIALPIVTAVKSSPSSSGESASQLKDPYPRYGLLKALAAQVAEDAAQ